MQGAGTGVEDSAQDRPRGGGWNESRRRARAMAERTSDRTVCGRIAISGIVSLPNLVSPAFLGCPDPISPLSTYFHIYPFEVAMQKAD